VSGDELGDPGEQGIPTTVADRAVADQQNPRL
jgi:hypothetical protein